MENNLKYAPLKTEEEEEKKFDIVDPSGLSIHDFAPQPIQNGGEVLEDPAGLSPNDFAAEEDPYLPNKTLLANTQKVLSPSELSQRTVTDRVGTGVAESIATIVSGMATSVYAGYHGLASLVYDSAEDLILEGKVNWSENVEEAADIIQSIQKDGTYVPKTEEGKAVLNAIITPLQWIDEHVNKQVGDFVNENVSGEPEVKAAFATAADMMTGWALFKGAAVTYKAATIGPKQIKDAIVTSAGGFFPKKRDAIIKKQIDTELQGELANIKDVAKKLDKAAEIDKRFGTKLTLAERLDDPTMAQSQHALSGKSREANITARDRLDFNRNAVRQYIDDTYGTTTAGASEIEALLIKSKKDLNAYRASISNKLDDIDKQRLALASQIDNASDDTMQTLGAKLRALDEKEYVLSMEAVEAAYADIKNVKLGPMSKIVVKLEELSKDPDMFAPGTTTLVPGMQKAMYLINRARRSANDTEFPVDVDLVRSLDKALGQGIASTKNADAQRMMYAVKDDLAAHLDTLEGMPNNIGKIYNNAKATYQILIAERFGTGTTAGKLREMVAANTYKISDAEIVRKWWVKGDKAPKAMDDFLKVHGNNPEAWTLLNDGANKVFLDKYLGKGVVVKPEMIQRFLNDYKQIFEKHPALKESWMNLATKVDDLNSRTAFWTGMQTKRDISRISTVLDDVSRDTRPADVVTKGLNDPSVMAFLKNRARKAGVEAENGLNKLIMDQIMAKTANKAPGAVDDLIFNSNWSPSIKKAFGKDHYDDLKYLADYYKREANVTISNKFESIPTDAPGKFQQATGTSVPSLISQVRSTYRMGVSKITVGAQLGATLVTTLSRKTYQQMELMKYYDPQTAQLLRKMATTNKVTPEIESGLGRVIRLSGGLRYAGAASFGTSEAASEAAKEDGLVK